MALTADDHQAKRTLAELHVAKARLDQIVNAITTARRPCCFTTAAHHCILNLRQAQLWLGDWTQDLAEYVSERFHGEDSEE